MNDNNFPQGRHRDANFWALYPPGPPVVVEINMKVRSMGPISEVDMVSVTTAVAHTPAAVSVSSSGKSHGKASLCMPRCAHVKAYYYLSRRRATRDCLRLRFHIHHLVYIVSTWCWAKRTRDPRAGVNIVPKYMKLCPYDIAKLFSIKRGPAEGWATSFTQ